jgi:hypothetical protein
MVLRSDAISAACTKSLSISVRMAWRAVSKAGYPVSRIVTQPGFAPCAAYITVNPPHSALMFRSESTTSNVWLRMAASASDKLAPTCREHVHEAQVFHATEANIWIESNSRRDYSYCQPKLVRGLPASEGRYHLKKRYAQTNNQRLGGSPQCRALARLFMGRS